MKEKYGMYLNSFHQWPIFRSLEIPPQKAHYVLDIEIGRNTGFGQKKAFSQVDPAMRRVLSLNESDKISIGAGFLMMRNEVLHRYDESIKQPIV